VFNATSLASDPIFLSLTSGNRFAAAARQWDLVGSTRPKGAGGGFLADCPLHLASGHSLNSSRNSQFSESGQSQMRTADRDKVTAERPLQGSATSRSRPIGVGGDFLSERPVYSGT
jgi:hypothetical protein